MLVVVAWLAPSCMKSRRSFAVKSRRHDLDPPYLGTHHTHDHIGMESPGDELTSGRSDRSLPSLLPRRSAAQHRSVELPEGRTDPDRPRTTGSAAGESLACSRVRGSASATRFSSSASAPSEVRGTRVSSRTLLCELRVSLSRSHRRASRVACRCSVDSLRIRRFPRSSRGRPSSKTPANACC